MPLEKGSERLCFIIPRDAAETQLEESVDFFRCERDVCRSRRAHAARGDEAQGMAFSIELRESAAHDAERTLYEMQQSPRLFLEARRLGYLLSEIGESREGVQKFL